MRNYLYIVSILTALLATSCISEEPLMDNISSSAPLEIYAGIKGSARTRALRWTIQDKWSYEDFTSGDEMGFYSEGGNWADDGGKGGFTNQALTYDGSKFTDPDGIEFSPSHMTSSKIFMYFPYSPVMDGVGVTLRVVPTPEELDEDDVANTGSIITPRCMDLLTSDLLNIQGVLNGKDMALYGEFEHAFSELIILRGPGFDAPPSGKERITAVLRDPVTNYKVEVAADPWACTPQMYYNAASGLSQDEAKRWDAWKGGNYAISEGDTIGEPAWYVIVPSIGSNEQKKKPGERSYVDYIEIYDNEGYLQRVSSLKLSGGTTKYVDAGWRYPMKISMEELVPTVNPFTITPWNETVDLTDERTRGINNISEFARWVYDYNAYLKDNKNQDKIDALLQYGDLYQASDDDKFWHFYVLNDLDFSNYRPYSDSGEQDGNDAVAPGTPIIPQLEDILDGVSTTLSNSRFLNHTVTGLTSPFIGVLTGKASQLMNFDFDSPEVKIQDGSTNPAGILVTKMDDYSTVLNCRIIDGDLLNPDGPSGMVVGELINGLVKDCTISGFMVGKSTAAGDGANIAGTATPEASFMNNKVTVVSGN